MLGEEFAFGDYKDAKKRVLFEKFKEIFPIAISEYYEKIFTEDYRLKFRISLWQFKNTISTLVDRLHRTKECKYVAKIGPMMERSIEKFSRLEDQTEVLETEFIPRIFDHCTLETVRNKMVKCPNDTCEAFVPLYIDACMFCHTEICRFCYGEKHVEGLRDPIGCPRPRKKEDDNVRCLYCQAVTASMYPTPIPNHKPVDILCTNCYNCSQYNPVTRKQTVNRVTPVLGDYYDHTKKHTRRFETEQYSDSYETPYSTLPTEIDIDMLNDIQMKHYLDTIARFIDRKLYSWSMRYNDTGEITWVIPYLEGRLSRETILNRLYDTHLVRESQRELVYIKRSAVRAANGINKLVGEKMFTFFPSYDEVAFDFNPLVNIRQLYKDLCYQTADLMPKNTEVHRENSFFAIQSLRMFFETGETVDEPDIVVDSSSDEFYSSDDEPDIVVDSSSDDETDRE